MMRSVALRLTLIYLAIIMALSVSFSIVIYRISYREMMRSFPPAKALIRYADPDTQINFDSIREAELEQSENNLRNNLILLNISTLVLGAVVSYALARRTLQPIEDAFEAQGRFTADASHELRTPLTAMRTTIEVGLRNPKLTLPAAKELLGSTLDEVQKLSALSNGLLKLTRRNGHDIPKVPVSMKPVVAASVAQLELAAKNKDISLKNEVGDVTVLGDEISLKEVVTILIDNAIKYSPKHTAVTVTSEQHGRHGVILVTDHGAGIKASDLVHIFDRFYRADVSRSRDHIEGYGLGLSIAQKIVEAHGGSISAKSQPGEGSTFIIKLPLSVNS